MPRQSLFQVRLEVAGEHWVIPYASIDDCLDDAGLHGALGRGEAVVSVWVGSMRITRDLTASDKLVGQLVSNAATLMRGRL